MKYNRCTNTITSINNMSKKLAIILTLSCIFAVGYSQKRTICGTITDPISGDPIIGASVVIDNTSIGTITDYEGKYCIEAEVGSIISVEYMGYEDKKFYVGPRKTEIYTGQRNKYTKI